MALDEMKLDRAIADLKEARRLEDQSPGLRDKLAAAYGQRGELLYHEKKYDRAISDLDEAIRLDPKSYAHFLRGLAHMEKGDNERAIVDQTEAIRLDPKMAEAYGARGMAYMKLPDIDRAKVDYIESLRLDPDRDFIRRTLASIYYKSGAGLYLAARMSVAMADQMGVLESMRDRLPNSGRRSCDIELEQALAELNEAFRLNPSLRDSFEKVKKDSEAIASKLPPR